jgi:hypothetical protein
MIKAIDRLFKRLSATYGAEWERSLGATPESDAKSVWAHELEQFKGSLHRIAWALENLPERCPNVIAFKNLCRTAPAPEEVALPAPKADPERMRAELAKLGHLRTNAAVAQVGRLDWASRILDNPKGRTPTVLQMAEDALA